MSGEHRQRCQEQTRGVPGSTGQDTRHHCQDNKNLRSVKKIVKWQDQGEEEPTGERNEEEAQICGDIPGQG